MNPRYFVVAGITSVACTMSVAHAEGGIVISPKVEVIHVDFSGSYSGTIGGVTFDNGYDISVQALRVGASVAMDKFYVDGYYQTSNDDSDNLLLGPTNYSFEGDRDEWVLTFGYRVTDNASLFVGTRQSDAEANASQGSKIEIEQDAYFFGGSLSGAVGDKGVVSVNAAYVHIDSVDYKTFNADVPASFKLDGDGDGWKLGASWTGAITDKFLYTVGMDYYSYDWDVDNAANDKVNADEDELFLRLGVSYLF